MADGNKKKENPVEKLFGDVFFKCYNAHKHRIFAKENALHAKAGENGSETAGPVVFLGDSITDMCDLKTFYPGLNCVNRGISGNTTRDVLDRMKLSVFDAAPSLVVLLIGINDMMNEGRDPREVACDYERIVCYLSDRLPGVPVILQSVYPGWNGDLERAKQGPTGQVFPIAYLKEDIRTLNGRIREIAENYGYVYADVYSHLVTEEGLMNPEYCADGCHPVAEGYKVISGVLRPLIDSALGAEAE